MPIIQTPKELGLTIRSRRKELGWDQATLAKQVGVTRQWVIEIEKGKPRAEVGLALRALRVLGLSLHVDAKQQASAAPGDERIEHPASGAAPNLDIDAIVERNRGAAVGRTAGLPSALAELPRTSADEPRAIELARRFDHLAGTVRPADDDPGSVAGGGGPEGKRKPGGSTKGKRPSKRVSKRSGSKK
ncbi:helix-turn-helix transcriptional regulator [Luteimonas sp. SJ-92]|uniref:Helix-turn-helix transcriptional regulator n=1 Tax=Luteimonas salinisoli TaxID=2752307 RepID=A0A853J9T7_9GAMM|nr:helix-turn-helix transcriptional regulator [Luteimonas salinisoli]NZA25439.1 helix-turn-helix transcriptional regulator [Luteimonas salinisoli]